MSKLDEFYQELVALQNKNNEIANKIKNNNQKKKDAEKNITSVTFDDVSYEEFITQSNLDHDLTSIRSYIFDALTPQIKDVNSYMDYFEFQREEFDSDAEYQSALHSRYYALYDAIVKSVKEYKKGGIVIQLADAIAKNDAGLKAKTTEGYKNACRDFFAAIQGKDYFDDFMAKNNHLIFQHLTSVNISNVEDTKKFLDKNKEYGLDLEVLSMKEVKLGYDYRKVADKPLLNKEIEFLKNAYKDDLEYCTALDAANDILKEGDIKDCNQASDVAESFASQCDIKQYELVEKKITSENPEVTKLLKYRSSSFTLKEDNEENRIKVREAYIDHSDIELPLEFQNKLKNIFQKIEDNGLYDKRAQDAEQGGKAYSLLKLFNLKESIQEAVERKDRDKLIKAVSDYKATEKVCDQLMKEVNELCPSNNIAGNISPARQQEIPAKYRNDPIGVSRLSGMWLIMGFLDKFKIDRNEFIQNPFKAIDKKLDEYSKNNPLADNLKSNDDLGDICNGIIAESDKHFGNMGDSKCAEIRNSLSRILDNFIRLIPDENLRAKYETEFYCRNATSYLEIAKNDLLLDYSNADNIEDKLLDIMATEKEDRDPRQITTGYVNLTTGKETHYDRSQYISEHKNFESILLRAESSRSNLYKKYPDEDWAGSALNAANSAVNLVNQLSHNKTDLISDAIRAYQSNRAFKETMKQNLASVSEFKKLSYQGINDKTITKAAHVYQELKEKYDHRSFFAKLFYRNVKQQSVLLDSYMTVFNQNGYSKDQVNDILAGRTVIEEQPEVIKDVHPVDLNEENNIKEENFVIDENELKKSNVIDEDEMVDKQ